MAKQGGELDAGMEIFGPNKDVKNSPAKTLGKLIGIGNLDSAAEAAGDLTTNLEKAMSQLTQPIASLSSALPKSNVFGGMFGEEKKFNTQASPQEIIGDLSNSYNKEQSSNDHQDQHHTSNQQNQQEYNPQDDQVLSNAGQQILSGGSEAFEHHDHLPQVQPQLSGTSVQEHDGSGRGH